MEDFILREKITHFDHERIPERIVHARGSGAHGAFKLYKSLGHYTKAAFLNDTTNETPITWDEAQKISGKDPDFHRRDLWESIETGNFPEWELGLQIIPEADELKYSFDLLDPTKLIPEELIPVMRVGKMTLNRNPDNFFAETEQVAFHPGHIVPGIDFSNDPLLQGRLFSYTDTQLSRLGSPNFHEIPINRSLSPMHNNQRDGHMRQTINAGKTNYHPNSISEGYPMQTKATDGGFVSYAERIDAAKIRNRNKSFFDHFSQATLFFNSQSKPEQQHLIDALTFELGKVEKVYIRERMLGLLTQVDKNLASKVATGLGLPLPKAPEKPINNGVSADANEKDYEPINVKPVLDKSAALSMEGTIKNTIKTRKVAFLVANGVKDESLRKMKKALVDNGATVKLISLKQGSITTEDGKQITVDGSFLTDASVCYDAIYIPDGKKNIVALLTDPKSIHFVNEAYKHCKPIASGANGLAFLKETFVKEIELKNLNMGEAGVITDGNEDKFIECIASHRFWNREEFRKVPA